MAATPAIGRHLSRMCAALLVTAASMRASATQEPLWEYGLGAGAVALNDYTGAGSSHVYPVPWGYLVYNGKFLKADRDGVRGLFVDQKWIEINMSANLTAPVRNNAARAGMPELRSTVQLGPSLDLHLYRSENSRVKLDLNLPVRAAVTIEAQPKDIGWVFAPNLDIDIRDVFNRKGWNLGLEAGPEFADAHYQNYFYSVSAQYALPTRPAYEAPGGYSGTQFFAAISKHYPKFHFAAYLHYDTLAGASFAGSPLVERRHDWSGGFGFAWMISRSRQMVEVPD
ncbi:MAG: MipA/OmpV family protein [Steroidobacteraceae bacterium]|jgi:outer membrane scaffolding protein for murein synthesis (MipA/OmpV family)